MKAEKEMGQLLKDVAHDSRNLDLKKQMNVISMEMKKKEKKWERIEVIGKDRTRSEKVFCF